MKYRICYPLFEEGVLKLRYSHSTRQYEVWTTEIETSVLAGIVTLIFEERGNKFISVCYLSRGNIIKAHITKKNTKVCKKKPDVVGHPDEEAIGMNLPNSISLNIYVSGLATKKNTKAL